jgi:hypothetical protein
MPYRLMSNSSPPTVRWRLRQHPGLETRSPLVMVTRRPMHPQSVIPTRAATSVSTKLCVDPESRRAHKVAPFTTTCTYIVRPELGWMPVSACTDIVGSSVSVGGMSSSSALSTSMENNYLHNCLCPFVNNSLQWKHFPSLWHCAIFAGDM